MADGIAREGFDIDLRFGQEREVTLAEVLLVRGGNHLELKSDQKARETGNVFVEFRQHGRPSGIAKTKAKWWTVEVMDNVFIVMETERVRALARQSYRLRGPFRGGDGNAFEGVLIPVRWLTEPWAEA